MRMDAGGGGMLGHVASEDRNYPVATTSMQFETSVNYPANVKGRFVTYLPKTHRGNNLFDGLVFDANGILSFNVDVLGFKPGIGGKLTIDNMPVTGGYEKVDRYEVFFTFTRGDKKKEKK